MTANQQRLAIAAFFWPARRRDIAWMLGLPQRRLSRFWGAARDDGRLPKIKRPPYGFMLIRLTHTNAETY